MAGLWGCGHFLGAGFEALHVTHIHPGTAGGWGQRTPEACPCKATAAIWRFKTQLSNESVAVAFSVSRIFLGTFLETDSMAI